MMIEGMGQLLEMKTMECDPRLATPVRRCKSKPPEFSSETNALPEKAAVGGPRRLDLSFSMWDTRASPAPCAPQHPNTLGVMAPELSKGYSAMVLGGIEE
jgi:hypothetical protein